MLTFKCYIAYVLLKNVNFFNYNNVKKFCSPIYICPILKLLLSLDFYLISFMFNFSICLYQTYMVLNKKII